MQAVQDKLKAIVASGQLGIFANGYWGHPAMKLPPEVNLMATAHYLQALEYQRKANMIVSILGSKTPHVASMVVGGVSSPINLDTSSALNMERLYYIKTLIDEVGSFVKNVYRARCLRRGGHVCGLDQVRRRGHQLPGSAGYAHGHQGHGLQPARRLYRKCRSENL